MTALPRRQLNRLMNEQRILDAALKVFSESGYASASMDAVAAEAGLSKPTLYQYFDSKERLFEDMMLRKRDDMLLPFAVRATDDMVVQLHSFAWSYADTVMQPQMMALARLILGELCRFPAIGRAYQAAGPDQLLGAMMDFLIRWREAGRLRFEDAELAAEDLWGLILSAPRTKALHNPDLTFSRDALARYIDNGLRVFLRAYSTDPESDLAALVRLPVPPSQQVAR